MWCTTIKKVKDKPSICQNYFSPVLVCSGYFRILFKCISLYQNTFSKCMITELHNIYIYIYHMSLSIYKMQREFFYFVVVFVRDWKKSPFSSRSLQIFKCRSCNTHSTISRCLNTPDAGKI